MALGLGMRLRVPGLIALTLSLGCSSKPAPDAPPPAPGPTQVSTESTAPESPPDAPDAPTGELDGAHSSTQSPATEAEAAAYYAAAIAAAKKQEPKRVVARLDGREVVMYQWEAPRLIVSESCAPQGKLGSCKALDAVRDVATKTITVGPGNPSSYYCAPSGGELESATYDDGEDSLCRYSDGSYAATWSLVYVPKFGREQIEKK